MHKFSIFAPNQAEDYTLKEVDIQPNNKKAMAWVGAILMVCSIAFASMLWVYNLGHFGGAVVFIFMVLSLGFLCMLCYNKKIPKKLLDFNVLFLDKNILNSTQKNKIKPIFAYSGYQIVLDTRDDNNYDIEWDITKESMGLILYILGSALFFIALAICTHFFEIVEHPLFFVTLSSVLVVYFSVLQYLAISIKIYRI